MHKYFVSLVHIYLFTRLTYRHIHVPFSTNYQTTYYPESYCDELLGLCVATDEWDSVLEVLAVMKDLTASTSRTESHSSVATHCPRSSSQ